MAIQLDHMILAVNDRKESIEFYVGILGLKYEGDSFLSRRRLVLSPRT